MKQSNQHNVCHQNLLILYVLFYLPLALSTHHSFSQQISTQTLHKNHIGKEKRIPLDKVGEWQILKYKSLPPNQISFSKNGLSIDVRKSASPVIYPLAKTPVLVKKVTIKGSVNRMVSIDPPHKQGESGWDDFNLRFGLVFLGSNRLNWIQRKVAPQWVLTLFNLAPKNQGVEHIYFLNATLSSQLLNRSRVHPLSKYIREKNVWLMNEPGSFSYAYTLPEPKLTGALWISVDGDDTKSSFDLKIKKMSIYHP